MFENQLEFDEIEEYGVGEYEIHGRGYVFIDLVKDKMHYISDDSARHPYRPDEDSVKEFLDQYDPDLQVVVAIRYKDAKNKQQCFTEIRQLLIGSTVLN